MTRTILHCDCNGFYASVECIIQPKLRLVPMAVAGDPQSRHGIILAKNELAKQYRIQTAETIWQAKQKCPDLVLVPPRHNLYAEYSKKINEIYHRYTDLIEPFGIDESWLDVSGVTHLFGDGRQIADVLRQTVRQELGLTISVGVSCNKIFAKLGSDYKKPDATTVITPDNYREMLHPLPVNRMLFVGTVTNQTLQQMQIYTIGQLAASDQSRIVARLGKTGEMIWSYANGLDDSPVRHAQQGREVKSVGNGMTFKRNLVGEDDIGLASTVLADEVASRLRKYGYKCGTVQVTIKDANFKSITRQTSLETPTYLAKEIKKVAQQLILATPYRTQPIRMLTITGANLSDCQHSGEQLSLFTKASHIESRKKQEKLELAMDSIREKFGSGSIHSGGVLQNELGIQKEE